MADSLGTAAGWSRWLRVALAAERNDTGVPQENSIGAANDQW
jgi:hypothetical protein